LIGDDESTDGTREICIEYAKKNPEKIKLFLHKRKNNIEILGRPCGIFQYIYNMLHTRGKYIAVCSGDDVWTDASKLQKQYNFLSSYPGYSMVYQLWKEKIVGKDNTFKLKTPKRTSKKPSTALFMNFKGEMPIQMLHVIQEDIFGWFILRSKGIFFCIKELSPVIINTPEESMMRSLSSLSRFEHVLNFKRKLYQSYKVSDRKQEAINEYMGIVGVIFKSNNRIKLKIIIIALKNIIKDGLLIDLIKNIFFKNNKV
jgi:glycosyltransferase involved in cell wall biosynthesis